MKFSKIKFLLLLFFNLLSCILYGQTLSTTTSDFWPQERYWQNKRIIFNYHYGFVLKNKTATAHLSNQRPSGFEIELNRITRGEAPWHSLYNYPETGISLQYWRMDPGKKLGDMLGLIFYVQKHLLRTGKSELLYRIGMGPGYVEKRFDLYNNNQNNLISNRLNFVLNGRLVYKYRLTSILGLHAGIGIVHFSNGGLKMPNQGINVPSVHAGLAYYFEEKPLQRTSGQIKNHDWFLVLFAAAGSKNDYPVESRNYLVTTTSIYGGKQLNDKSVLLAGFDYFYDGTMKIWADSIDRSGNFLLTKWAVTAGHELLFGRLALITHLGYLIYDPIPMLSRVYQRYGLKFFLTNKVAASISMKAHLGRADFVEWGLSYHMSK